MTGFGTYYDTYIMIFSRSEQAVTATINNTTVLLLVPGVESVRYYVSVLWKDERTAIISKKRLTCKKSYTQIILHESESTYCT